MSETVKVLSVHDRAFSWHMNVVRQEHLPPSSSFSLGPDLIYAGTRAYRAIQWQAQEWRKWADRDWRRQKRERRKFMKAANPRPTHPPPL